MTHWDFALSEVDNQLDRQARKDHRTLFTHERFWGDRQVWLAERGYMLRSRYKPNWEPSWEGAAWRRHEDGIAGGVSHI